MSELMDTINSLGALIKEERATNEQMLAEERKGNEARARELKDAVERIGADIAEQSKQREILERKFNAQQERLEVLEAVSSRPGKTPKERLENEYKDAWVNWMRSGGKDQTLEHECKSILRKGIETKVIAAGSAADGGLAVPEEISRAIDKYVLAMSDIVAQVKQVQVGTTDYVELISSNDLGYGWSTESGTRSATANPELISRTPTWGELYTLPSAYNWALEDIFFNVEGWLTDCASEQFAVGLSTAIYNGNGSGKPTGMFASAPTASDDYASPRRAAGVLEYIPLSTPSSPFTSDGVNFESLIDLVKQLKRQYLPNARFAMNRTTQAHVRKLKNTNGDYLWQPSLQVGMPDMLLGYSTFIWEDLGNPTTSNAYPVVFGDFRRGYTLATRSGMSMIRDPYSTKGTTQFYLSRRYGGCVANCNALKVLKVAVS